ncbi:MAG: hypothetical protein N3J91_03525 [Verrucomicrobiae bacterium]|nr:hypothetical protein [Verrucomicrobiae bacterium]
MNAPDLKYWALMALIFLCCLGILAVRQPPTEGRAEAALLVGMPLPEIPTAAVRQLQGVSPGRRVALANQMVQELAQTQPAVMPYLLVALSRHFPELAPWLLVEAIAAQPAQTVASVRAVSAAVPEQMEVLITHCVRSLPDAFPVVAIAAAEQRPESAETILRAVARALPEAASALETAARRQSHFPLNVRQVLAEADRLLDTAAPSEASAARRRTASHPEPENSPRLHGPGSQNPFACLQQLARARMEKLNQMPLMDNCTNGSVPPSTALPSLSHSSSGVSLDAAHGGNIKESESRVEVR